ncbi:MAG: hypothetical protein ACKOCM_02050 [Cyanobacteriota bacterium]
MYATLREYEGIEDPVEALEPLRAGLLAEMEALPGFMAYYFVDVGAAAQGEPPWPAQGLSLKSVHQRPVPALLCLDGSRARGGRDR